MEAQIASNGAGDYALGFTVDGAFVPMVTVAKHRVAHLVERQQHLEARAVDPSHEGHGPALDALDADWHVIEKPKPSRSSSKGKDESTDKSGEA